MLAAAVLCASATAEPVISAASAIVMDAETGRVLFAHEPDRRSLIASTTKIMTGLLIAEDCTLSELVPITAEAADTEGSSLDLREGECRTVEELLYGLLLHSGNDAAVALAEYHSGSVEAFSDAMNRKAAELGLINTHLSNPHGLDAPEHYSTARELALLSAYAMDNLVFSQIVGTKEIVLNGRTYQNHNKLLWRYEGCTGVKTGYTRAAGRILVSCAGRDGHTLIVVTINDPNDWSDHARLLDYGFARMNEYKENGGSATWRNVCKSCCPAGALPPGGRRSSFCARGVFASTGTRPDLATRRMSARMSSSWMVFA